MSLLRLKRSLDEEQVGDLLIAFKKRKEDQTSVFKFAKTLLDEKEDVFQHFSNLLNTGDHKELYKQKEITNITQKLRNDNKLYSKNNRLKLVNCLRKTVDSASDNSKEFTLIDLEIEQEKHPESTAAIIEKENKKFAYDIYYAPHNLSDLELNPDSEISCHIIDSEMVFEGYRDNAYGDDAEFEDDDDDSNDENNWRNDYPDEEDDSIGEEDMKLAARCRDLNLDDSNDLSSDEDLLHCFDVSSEDVALYGEGYAKYKKKIQQQNLLSDDEGGGSGDYYDYISSSDSEKSML